jgi:hypothetical protein
MVPDSKFGQIFGSMANEDAQIVHPGCREEHLLIIDLIFGEFGCEFIESGLVAEFIRRICIRPDKFNYRGPVALWVHL